jgi:hypothetical protein
MGNTFLSIPDDVAEALTSFARGLRKHVDTLQYERSDCEGTFSCTNPDWQVLLDPEYVQRLAANLTTTADFCDWLASREAQVRMPEPETEVLR